MQWFRPVTHSLRALGGPVLMLAAMARPAAATTPTVVWPPGMIYADSLVHAARDPLSAKWVLTQLDSLDRIYPGLSFSPNIRLRALITAEAEPKEIAAGAESTLKHMVPARGSHMLDDIRAHVYTDAAAALTKRKALPALAAVYAESALSLVPQPMAWVHAYAKLIQAEAFFQLGRTEHAIRAAREIAEQGPSPLNDNARLALARYEKRLGHRRRDE